MYKYKCRRCGADFESAGTFAKYCPTCRRIVRTIQANNSYHRLKGHTDKIKEVNPKKPREEKPKKYCPLDNCPFKSGYRHCLFYFEYKDGTATCPNAKALKEYYKQKMLESE